MIKVTYDNKAKPKRDCSGLWSYLVRLQHNIMWLTSTCIKVLNSYLQTSLLQLPLLITYHISLVQIEALWFSAANINTEVALKIVLCCHKNTIIIICSLYSCECLHMYAVYTVCECVCFLCLLVLPSNSWDIYRYSFNSKARGAREQSIGLRSHGN